MRNNILITSAGRRVDLVESFRTEIKLLDSAAKVFCVDLNPRLSSACQIADVFFEAPRVTSKEYILLLKKMCIDNSIGLVIPTIDTELLILSKFKNMFLELGINIVVSDEALIKACRNKNNTAGLFGEIGIDTPKIYNLDAIHYPCFVKPYDGSCSVGTFILDNKSMLTDDILKNKKNIFMELVPSSYDEYTVDIYFDRNGVLKSLVPRLRIETRAGEVSKGLTSKNAVYSYLKGKLNFLKGAIGCITLQLFANLERESFKAIEINPRFGGGYPLAYSAGANFPRKLIQEYILGKNIDFFDDWEDNLLMLRYDSKIIINDYKA